MAVTKTLTKALQNKLQLTRWEEKDYSDDGTHFKMFLYKGRLPVSYTTSEGYNFVCIRPDYADYGNTGHKFWREEYKDSLEVENEFNGVQGFDAEKLAENLEVTYKRLEVARNLWVDKVYSDIDNYKGAWVRAQTKVITENEKAIVRAAAVNWLEAPAEVNISEIKKYYSRAKEAVEAAKENLSRFSKGHIKLMDFYENRVAGTTFYAKELNEAVAKIQ